MKIEAKNLKKRTRLDSYIGMAFPSISRSTIKKLVLSNVVTVNGEIPKFNKILVEGDEIEFKKEELENYINQNSSTEIIPTQMNIDILHEDESIIVVNKNEGMVVHPSYNHTDDTLMNGLVYYIQNKKEAFTRIRPVNRLDKETSGVILFSKNLESHNYYSSKFKKREVRKEYLAVIKGNFNDYLKGEGAVNINSYIGKSPEGFKYRISTDSLKSEFAETEVTLKNTFYYNEELFSLLKVIPHTGRTHQIRVHLESIGYPIVGDSIYNGYPFKRLLLHSHKLKLVNMQGTEIEFTAEPKNWI